MRRIFFPAVLATCLVTVATPSGSGAADLKVRFKYAGGAVEPSDVNVTNDKEFCGKHPLVNEKLLVNPDNGGIKNVIVYVYTGRGGTDLAPELMKPRNETVTLANAQCRFEPRIVLAQKGDTLKVTNPDEVGHNCNLNFFKNTAVNFNLPAKSEKSVELESDEPAPIPADCNIHPWMRSYIVVLEHPFAASSDDNGELTITGLPEGEVTFRVFHEAGRIDEVEIDGKKEGWRRSRFEIDLESGMNDLGTVVVPADALSAN